MSARARVSTLLLLALVLPQAAVAGPSQTRPSQTWPSQTWPSQTWPSQTWPSQTWQRLSQALRSAVDAPGKARARGALIRTTMELHKSLVAARVPLTLPQSDVLKERERQRLYSASWTCRSSTELLIAQLKQRKLTLQLSSSGENTFRWGKEGLVSYHYYAVDDPARPSLLVDPTAASNFGANDIRTGGLLRGLLASAGRKLGEPRAAERVVTRLQRAGDSGLLVLANRAEIDVYREALERAAEMLRGQRH
jgi:hypothetical protein